ncbi:ABC transporter permease [Prosthecodimorpha staleyi]|uniref:ABC transporter permease n=1 Tax=Prosthecodimorpha staleyi TaxID=2840188 RepID=A0A947D378_9HYPH|nr:ABC transporter permease [Prosthecodimorpha staleyi]MBT9289478.1 ABC transporter permease [Prosthecodimorpha staleyi]
MLSFLVRRLAGLAVTLLATALVVFVVLEILPGDPAAVILGVSATPETVAALRTEFGLDLPAPERFIRWIGGLLTGDLGTSYGYRVPVAQLIAERLQVTLPLAFAAILLATLVGVPLGMLAASRPRGLRDAGVMVFAQAGLALPDFWVGILLVLAFAIGLHWLPSGGFPGWDAGLGPALASLVLPVIALALPQAAILARVTRSATLEALQEDWVRTARAKGLGAAATLYRHVLRNALVPVVTMLGVRFSFMIAGAIIIEDVFSLPGLGRLMFQAIGQHDIIVVKDLVVVFAALVVGINFLVDIAYGIVDPRLRRRA